MEAKQCSLNEESVTHELDACVGCDRCALRSCRRAQSAVSSASASSAAAEQSTLGWLVSSLLSVPSSVLHSLSHTDQHESGSGSSAPGSPARKPRKTSAEGSPTQSPKKSMYGHLDLEM